MRLFLACLIFVAPMFSAPLTAHGTATCTMGPTGLDATYLESSYSGNGPVVFSNECDNLDDTLHINSFARYDFGGDRLGGDGTVNIYNGLFDNTVGTLDVNLQGRYVVLGATGAVTVSIDLYTYSYSSNGLKQISCGLVINGNSQPCADFYTSDRVSFDATFGVPFDLAIATSIQLSPLQYGDVVFFHYNIRNAYDVNGAPLQIEVVPEPSTVALTMAGLLLLVTVGGGRRPRA